MSPHGHDRDETTYRFRASAFRPETTYTLGEDALTWSGGGNLPFADVRHVRVYDAPGVETAGGAVVSPPTKRCVLWPKRGRKVVLVSNHFEGFGRFENRSESFDPFVASLVRRIARANPAAVFLAGMPAGLWWLWAGVLVVVVLAGLLAAAIAVTGLADGTWLSWDFAFAIFFGLGMLSAAVSIVGLLRRNGTRQFDPRRAERE